MCVDGHQRSKAHTMARRVVFSYIHNWCSAGESGGRSSSGSGSSGKNSSPKFDNPSFLVCEPHLALVGVVVADPRSALDERLHVQRQRVLEGLLDLHSLQRLEVELEPVKGTVIRLV